jgi:hypothetical protein
MDYELTEEDRARLNREVIQPAISKLSAKQNRTHGEGVVLRCAKLWQSLYGFKPEFYKGFGGLNGGEDV